MNSDIHPNRILIIRLSSIGDVLLTSPMLRVLRRRFPNATIDFVIKKKFKDAIRTNPHIDHVWPYDIASGLPGLIQLRRKLKTKKFDLILDLHNNFRSRILRKLGAPVRTLKKLKLNRFLLVKFKINRYPRIIPVHQRYINTTAEFGIEDDGKGLEFYVDAGAQKTVDERLKSELETSRPIIGIAPGAGFAAKRWLPEYFAHTAKVLQQEYQAQIWLFGNQDDRTITDMISEHVNSAVNLAGELPLMQTAAALNRINLLLTNDTGLMHLATALKKPTVAVFGPTVRELGFFPVGENALVVEHPNLSCRPCTHMGRHECPKGHFKCMREVTPEQVLRAVQRFRLKKT